MTLKNIYIALMILSTVVAIESLQVQFNEAKLPFSERYTQYKDAIMPLSSSGIHTTH